MTLLTIGQEKKNNSVKLPEKEGHKSNAGLSIRNENNI